MPAFNVVRFRVKPGCDQAFIDAHRTKRPPFRGFEQAHIVNTGDRTYCFIGRWRSMDSLIAARPEMIAFLDTFRDLLEDLGGGLGVTDPVSGASVYELKTAKSGKKKSSKKKGKKVSKKKSGKKTAAKRKSAKKKSARKKSGNKKGAKRKSAKRK